MRPLLLAALVAGCASPTAAAPDRLPEVEAFRAELADPARHPLRHGLEVDEQGLKSALEAFASGHREILDRHFRATLDALPEGTLPTAPEYGLVAEISGPDAAPFLETTETYYRVDPDARRLARGAISMMVPRMAQTIGLAVSRLGPWMVFLSVATPDARVVKRDLGGVVVDLDYGGQDVFLVTFTTRPTGWAVSAVAWRQRGRVEPPKPQ
jgi:hypothetical protein